MHDYPSSFNKDAEQVMFFFKRKTNSERRLLRGVTRQKVTSLPAVTERCREMLGNFHLQLPPQTKQSSSVVSSDPLVWWREGAPLVHASIIFGQQAVEWSWTSLPSQLFHHWPPTGQLPVYAGAGDQVSRWGISDIFEDCFSAGCVPFDPVL